MTGVAPEAARPLFRAAALQARRDRLQGRPLHAGRLARMPRLPQMTRRRGGATPLVLQCESAECGLACLAMVAGHHGHEIDLASLRERHPISSMGATLGTLMDVADSLQLAARPLRVEPDELAHLALPCILHWDFNHFVVLAYCDTRRAVVHDPAAGRREMALATLGRHFTGAALELMPTPRFERRDERRPLPLGMLVGRLPGLAREASRVLALALLLQLLALLAPFYLRWLVDDALRLHDHALVAVLGVAFLLVALLQAGVGALRGWAIAVLGTRLHLQLHARLLHHMLRLPMTWFERRETGDVLSRYESLRTIQRTLGTSFLEALVDGAMALLTLGLMLATSPRLALVGIAAAAAYAGLRLLLHRAMRAAADEHLLHAAAQHGHLIETLRGMQAVKLFGHETRRFARWHDLATAQGSAGLRIERLGLVAQAANTALFGFENVLTLWLGALLVLDSQAFSLGMLFAFLATKAQFVQRVAAFVDKALELRMLGLHAQRVGDIALARAEPGGHEPGTATATPALAARIELKGVGFRHAEGAPYLFRGLDAVVEPGESVAIVGPSGCGKTTLVKLMLGLLDPTEGSIEVDGLPLAVLGPARYRAAIASVMQDDALFAGTIADNIAFFDAHPDAARIESCARQAAVHDEILAMPMRYETAVGSMGSVLSGGQKQRVLLARALYRRPRLLFLDEATSHLDVARERCVSAAVRALAVTRIIVAHRAETIASADRVIRLGEPSMHQGRQEDGRPTGRHGP
jgi:ATP-binding cassette subfamily B protein RaxB